MKMLFFFVMTLLVGSPLYAVNRDSTDTKVGAGDALPDLTTCILQGQKNVSLFVENLDSNARQKDVNSIIVAFQQYIDSLPANRSGADALLAKHYAALRMFFLTTTNKTAVATSFLAVGNPFSFCTYNDTASALYLGALKDGELYNAGKMTEQRIVRQALTNCLLPSLKALGELKNNEATYIGLSIYYGCEDVREGAPATAVTPFCLTFVARLYDIEQYNMGNVTAKGLLEQGTLYLSGAGDYLSLRTIQADME
jgi:hypothetical protein